MYCIVNVFPFRTTKFYFRRGAIRFVEANSNKLSLRCYFHHPHLTHPLISRMWVNEWSEDGIIFSESVYWKLLHPHLTHSLILRNWVDEWVRMMKITTQKTVCLNSLPQLTHHLPCKIPMGYSKVYLYRHFACN